MEIKKTFNLPLLLQGIERQKLSPEVYLAVERNRNKRGAHNQRWSDITNLCRRLGLGLITVTQYKTKSPVVEILCSPGSHVIAPSPRAIKARTSKLLYEFNERSGDYNIGGSHGTKLVTAYREKALRVALALQQGGEMSPREIRDKSGIGHAASILQKDYYGWFKRVSRGRYILNSEGAEGLSQYSSVIEGWHLIAPAVEKEESSLKKPGR
ncbi:hypothetical protein D3C78_792260 [compost metagenome]